MRLAGVGRAALGEGPDHFSHFPGMRRHDNALGAHGHERKRQRIVPDRMLNSGGAPREAG